MSYNPQKIESKWQRIWERQGTFQVDLKKAKRPYYNLMMFPYPSAEGLHVGNVYAFTGSDIHGRFKKMQGYDVFEPMGFDAFGIHSENFAIKKRIHPKVLIQKNINNFRQQLKNLGCLFDWRYEADTTKPSYYKWTQWLFLQLFKAGLAYRKKAPVDWCPSCKTVLANEQVINGKCERCDSNVVQKELEQWFFRITKYAERLLKSLDKINWSERTKLAQKNWIGKSIGAKIEFKIKKTKLNVQVFTTRPDTLFGCTYLVLAPEHSIISELKPQIKNWDEVQKYIEESKKKTELERIELIKEKTGVELKGIKAVNPADEKEIPIFAAEYVLASYGTGAIMAVPAHDRRDFDFAKRYNLPVREVITSQINTDNKTGLDRYEKAYEGEGVLINSGKFIGMKSEKAKLEITKFVKGKKAVSYHLRDWLISRQRYWGPPIPLVFCENCAVKIKNKKSKAEFQRTRREMKTKFSANIKNNEFSEGELQNPGWIAIRDKDLPVLLPYVKDFRPKGTGKSPLASVEKFVKTRCPKCKGLARREADVSDTFLDSSWYFFGYLFKNLKLSFATAKRSERRKQSFLRALKIGNSPFSNQLIRKWCPVDMYIGGQEHAVLHLLYSRFITMALENLGHIDFEEPFKKFRAHGLLTKGGAKMSKSKGNVVNPDDYYQKYGADTLRVFLMFLGPFSEGGDWQDKGIVGVKRFLDKVWALNLKISAKNKKPATKNLELEKLLHKTIKKVTEDLEGLNYNTAISALMILINEALKQSEPLKIENWKLIIKLLSPFAPHITEELWQKLGNKDSIHRQPWPKYDKKMIKEDKTILVIQINGKVRDKIEVESDISEKEAKKLILDREKVKKWIEGREIKKVIFVPDKLINIVI